LCDLILTVQSMYWIFVACWNPFHLLNVHSCWYCMKVCSTVLHLYILKLLQCVSILVVIQVLKNGQWVHMEIISNYLRCWYINNRSLKELWCKCNLIVHVNLETSVCFWKRYDVKKLTHLTVQLSPLITFPCEWSHKETISIEINIFYTCSGCSDIGKYVEIR